MHCFVLLLVDLILVAISTVLAFVLRDNLETSPERLIQILPYVSVTVLAAVPVLLVAGLNRTLWRFSYLVDYLRIAVAIFVTVLVAVAGGFAMDRLEGVPRSLPIVQGLLMAVMLVGARVAMRLRQGMRNSDRGAVAPLAGRGETVLVVGINSIAELFLRCVAENAGERLTVAGLLAGADRHRGRLLRSYPVLGAPEEIGRVLHDLEVHGVLVDRIVITTRFDRLSAAAQAALLHVESTSSICLDVLPERIGLSEPPQGPSTMASAAGGGHALAGNAAGSSAVAFALDLEALASRPYLRWKRVFDTAAAVVCAICLAPVMLLVGLVVLLDVGYPAIFWQQRPGALGRPIRVFKFRTMGAARDERGRRLSDDERVSVVGRLLRRVRLDELPQVYNVLTGQMSLVGPRPLLPIDQSPESYARLAVRPGLTGWAQVMGGRELSAHDKAALDIWYVKHVSFKLDMEILLRTLGTILLGERVDRDAIRQAWREVGVAGVHDGRLVVPSVALARSAQGHLAVDQVHAKSGSRDGSGADDAVLADVLAAALAVRASG